MLVIFNHDILTDEQVLYAHNKLNVSEIIYMPNELKLIWKQIDPLAQVIDLKLIEEFILKNTIKNDFILIQGEFGATYKLVNFCFKHKRIPIYATSERQVVEKKKADNSVEKRSLFRFIRFRKYKS